MKWFLMGSFIANNGSFPGVLNCMCILPQLVGRLDVKFRNGEGE
jgi:hypothetical protein